ncbi:MAG: hypothetical protein JW874_08725 [Spirochaetales bacterium]|nr:hypothetical protein [Spirochaetales bacterium]
MKTLRHTGYISLSIILIFFCMVSACREQGPSDLEEISPMISSLSVKGIPYYSWDNEYEYEIEYALSPQFDPYIHEYEVLVPYTCKRIEIDATTYFDGSYFSSDETTYHDTENLVEGINYHSVYVYSDYEYEEDYEGDGYSTYSIHIIRQEMNDEFVTLWDTENTGYTADNQIMLPFTPAGTYDCTVDWGDGTTRTVTSGAQEIIHSYAESGVYEVRISGVIDGINFGQYAESTYDDDPWYNYDYFAGDSQKLTEIRQWGSAGIGSGNRHFANCYYLNIKADDAPDLSGTTDFGYMFYKCGGIAVNNMGNWDISGITNFEQMFYESGVGSIYGESYNTYDDLLIGWSSQDDVPYNMIFHAGSSAYTSAGEAARDILIDDYNWSIIESSD